MVNYVQTYIYTRQSSLNLNSDTMEPEWHRHDCPMPVLLQSSISSAIFNLLHFHFCKDKFSACFQQFYFNLIFFNTLLKTVSLKMHN